MISLNSIVGRLALFIVGHVVVLGLVVVLSMSAGQAVPDRSSEATIASDIDTVTTGSIRR